MKILPIVPIMLAMLAMHAVPASAQVSLSPAAPTTAAPAASPPRISLCRTDDVIGMWMLVRVFETPAGAWTTDFQQYPYQYRMFDRGVKKLYFELKGTKEYPRPGMLRKALLTSSPSIAKQYTVGDKGAVFFYENGAATGSLYCGIVNEDRAPYQTGDMVLTPTQASSAQIFLLYRHPNMRKQGNARNVSPGEFLPNWNPMRPNAPTPGR